jgi:hypothetical protein
MAGPYARAAEVGRVNTRAKLRAVSGRFLKAGAADGVVFGAGENGREQTFTARRDQ